VELVLELAQLVVPADERGLEGLGPIPPTAFRDDAQGPPGRNRTRLALEDLVAGLLELIDLEAARWVASPTSTVPGSAID
jgi:hypothetical protein